ncbi:hypothetical protein AAG570_007599, partial [Ranatra chinensis]
AALVAANGYPVERHEVTTEDGYILTLFRIPHGRGHSSTSSSPLLLMHGLMCSSDCWVLPIPEKGLGYILADAGYDVWIGNNRGNTYSRHHVKLRTNDPQFWDYSFHEMGYYDLPAVIDYILNYTGRRQIKYVGHSQGTTQYFIMASTKPKYNSKVSVVSALAPVAYLEQAKGVGYILAKSMPLLDKISRLLGVHCLFDHTPFDSLIDRLFCRENSIFQPICQGVVFLIAGFDSPQLNQTLMLQVGQYCPTGASIKQLMHFRQLITNGKFTQYDYGVVKNLIRYKSFHPPEYDLNLVTTPVYLHYSQEDYLARPKDVERLAKVLPASSAYEVPYKQFNHVDYMWATDVNELLYSTVLKILKCYD